MLVRDRAVLLWHTPIAWTGYILFVDGVVWKRRGDRRIRNDRAGDSSFWRSSACRSGSSSSCTTSTRFTTGTTSVFPKPLLVRYVGYAWSFATISPAIFMTARARRRDFAIAVRRPTGAADPCRIPLDACGLDEHDCAGSAMLLVPIVYPSPWLAAPVWLGFIFLLDPLNAQARRGIACGATLRADASVAAGQPDDLGLRLRAALGVLELLGGYEVDLHGARSRPTSSSSRCRSSGFSGFRPSRSSAS